MTASATNLAALEAAEMPADLALRCEDVRTPEALAALGPEWSALAAAHGEGLPFRTFEWAETWWRWFSERRFAVRDALAMRAFRAPDGRLVAVAPLIAVQRFGHGPAIIRSLEFLGADPYVTEVRGPLVDPAHEGAVYRALRDELLRCRRGWDWVGWRGVPAGGEGARLLAGAGVALTGQVIGYTLPLEGDWEAFKASRPRNLKEALRKCYNSLKRDGHAFTLEVARTPAEVREGVARFLEFHRMRAEADGLKAHGNVFSDPASRGFLFDVCDRLARRDAVRVFQLRVGDRYATARVAFALGDTLYLYFSGYDPAWARYSVMTTTVAEAIRYAFEQGFRRVHLSTGTDESKLRWRPEATTWLDGPDYAPGARSATARWLSQRLTDPSGRAQRMVRALLGRRRQAP